MRNFRMEKGTYVKSPLDTSKMMQHLLLSLMPIILFGIFKNGVIPYYHQKVGLWGLFLPLIMILVAMITSTIVEVIYEKLFFKNKNTLKHLLFHTYAFMPGLFLALIIPLNTPLEIVVLGSFIATVFGKMVFGGFGKNIFNPALVGRFVIMLFFAAYIAKSGGYLNAYEFDTISSSTPLSNASLIEGIGSYKTLVEPFGNFWNFFVGNIPGTIGETSALLILLAFFYLTFKKIIKWTIPVIYIMTVFLMTYLIGNYYGLGIWYPLFHLLSGGLLFGAVFMATDPVTTPVTPIGQVIFGLFLGILTVALRFLGLEPESVMYSILIMNALSKVLDLISAKARFNFYKVLPIFIFGWLLLIGLGLYIATTLKVEPTVVDKSFNVINKVVTDTITEYTVTQKSFKGNIKARIIIDNGVVTTYEILEEPDSYYSLVSSTDYIDQLVKNQDNLESVDTVSGATNTSNNIKLLLQNTLNEYKK